MGLEYPYAGLNGPSLIGRSPAVSEVADEPLFLRITPERIERRIEEVHFMR